MDAFADSPWPLKPLAELTQPKELVNPKNNPEAVIRYIDIASVSNKSFEVVDTKTFRGSEAPSRARKMVRDGDVLFATTRPYLRNVALVTTEFDGAIASTGLCVLRPNNLVTSDWLYYLALSDELMKQVTSKMRGANYPAVSDGDVLDALVPLPPLDVQRRVVQQISDTNARVDEIRKLRAQACEQAGALLASTLEEVFASLDGTIPQTTIGEISVETRYGTSNKCNTQSVGLPILRIPNVQVGYIDFTDLKYLDADKKLVDKLRLRVGDLLVVRTNGSPNLVGRCAVFAGHDCDFGYASYLIRIRVDQTRVLPRYLSYFLASTSGRDQIATRRRTSAGQFNINSTSISSIALPLPGLGRQEEMVKRMADVQAAAAKLMDTLSETAAMADQVAEAVLRRAFAGEL